MKQGSRNSQDSNLILGLIILVIGSVWLLKELGIIFPGWMLSWPMIFIVLGLIILTKHRFRSGVGFFILLLGSYFLIKREFNIPIDLGPYLIPLGLILLGLYLILNRRGNTPNHFNAWGGSESILHQGEAFTGEPPGDKDVSEKKASASSSGKSSADFKHDHGDFLHSQAFFCGVQKRMLSKNFKGGKVSAIFGSTEIDLRKADFEENAFMDVELVFGGLKLIVPPEWDLQINVSNVFAGVEDKRIYPQTSPDSTKVLSIKGTVIFSGLEIKSF